jgi:tRNA threonylcarbamoyladenosine biosynthesis protein TsaE
MDIKVKRFEICTNPRNLRQGSLLVSRETAVPTFSRYTVLPRMEIHEYTTGSAEETVALGRTLAGFLVPPKLVVLRGDLGAGKTTLVKGIAQAFGAADEENVTSPTFTLVHEYRGPAATLYHIDLYRVDTPRELETLGLDDLVSENSILLIEWGEKFDRFQRDRDVEIFLERMGERQRRIHVVTGRGPVQQN